jgi:signal transduction histidine kinase/CheY-like chemotaxis protein
MSGLPHGFKTMYVSGLRSQLVQSGEYPLHQAYELGRQALAEGLGVVDLTLLHHDALAELMLDRAVEAEPDALPLAADFLAECLSPFEMTLRGYQEANARLTELHADLAHTHEQLKSEVAERRRAEEALFHAQKLQAIGKLAGGVAHHFNNLLTVILGNLELIRPHLGEDENITRRLTAAQHGARRGAEVVRQLLTFSRQQIVQPQPVDPAAWLAGLTPLLSSSLRGDIALETEVKGDGLTIEVDPGELELALLNLAVNARDAMPDGGVLKISVERRRVDDKRLKLHGDFVVIEVADTGEGVPPEIQSRVFEPFFTTKSLGPGAGLGLSQVHGFAHQAGGAVELESAVGQGAKVRLFLPPSWAAGAAAAAHDPAASQGAGRVLVVEDDLEIADLAAAMLESSGYAVTVAHQGNTALELLQRGEPVDLVFSDVVLPGGMNGVELARKMRRLRPRLPILLATGYSDSVAEADAQGLALIAKPYQGDELRRRIEDLLKALQGPQGQA